MSPSHGLVTIFPTKKPRYSYCYTGVVFHYNSGQIPTTLNLLT